MRVAIVGCGRMGKERARSAVACGAKVVAVFDQDFQRATALAALHPGCVVTFDVFAAAPDTVLVCSPPSSRGPVELQAINRRVPFFVEKPIGINAIRARPILDALAGINLVQAVGYQNRVRSSVRQVKRSLAGRMVLAISATWVGRKYSVPWWLRLEESGGPFNEQATHMIDLCRYLCGEIDSVNGFIGAVRGYEPLSAALALRFTSGAFGSLFYSCEANEKQIGIRIITSEGSIILSSWDLALTVNESDLNSPTLQSEDIFVRETQEFFNAVASNDATAVSCTFEDAYKTQQAVDLILKLAQ